MNRNATAENAGKIREYLTFGEIMRRRRTQIALAIHIMGALLALATIFLYVRHPARALNFVEIGFTLWAILEWWVRFPGGLPYLPALLLVEGTFFLLPLLVGNPGLDDFTQKTLDTACIAVVCFFATMAVAWLAGMTLGQAWPSRMNFDFISSGGASIGLKVGLTLLGFDVAFNASNSSGLTWTLIGGDAGLFSILRSLAGTSGCGGAFFGGLLMNRKEVNSGLKILYWVLLILDAGFNASGLLLFSTVIYVVAFVLGSILAGSVPWRFLLISACILAFLNFGKFPMRAKYLNEEGAATPPTLLTLPAYYAEWAGESLRLMGLGRSTATKIEILNEGEEGQPVYYRIDEMVSLLFITDIMERNSIAPLGGATYTLIPPLLIPRLFWPNKPIVHGGQVMLNLYFGRQQTLEQTERTFVAWGWLPEAVGNFGIFGGALFIGGVLGFLLGFLEKWSATVQLLSVEGFVMGIFIMLLVNSWGTAASIFATTAFQSICSALAGGFLIYSWQRKQVNQAGAVAASQRRRARRLQPAPGEP